MKNNMLKNFTKNMLGEFIYSGDDAATYFVKGECEDPPPHIEKILSKSCSQRIYPVDGGHIWKVPYDTVKGDEKLFKKEVRGWDHEHCDFCGATIDIGDTCWLSGNTNSEIFIFCEKCYKKVKSI